MPALPHRPSAAAYWTERRSRRARQWRAGTLDAVFAKHAGVTWAVPCRQRPNPNTLARLGRDRMAANRPSQSVEGVEPEFETVVRLSPKFVGSDAADRSILTLG